MSEEYYIKSLNEIYSDIVYIKFFDYYNKHIDNLLPNKFN